jgi:hypothetical protein
MARYAIYQACLWPAHPFKRAPRAADTSSEMVRSFAVLLVLIPVAIVGYLYSVQMRGSNGSKPVTSRITEAQTAAVNVTFTQAAQALEQDRALNATYEGADLTSFGVTLARATPTSYCIQAAEGTTTYHEAGPGGAPTPGTC